MPNTITKNTLVDGERNLVISLRILSDGDEETATSLVDVSAFNTTEVRLASIKGFIASFQIELLWDATTDVPICAFGAAASVGTGVIDIDFTENGRYPGIPNTKATGWTGDVFFSTLGTTAADKAFLVFHFLKA